MKWYEKPKKEVETEVPKAATIITKPLQKEEEVIVEEPFIERKVDNVSYNKEEKYMTNISKDAEIVGNISCKEDIRMSGVMKGDISCTQHLYVDGSVSGNVEANTLQLENAAIEGDITCSSDATVNEATKIKGNITAGSLVIGGYIEGDLTIDGELYLQKTAVIKGNITAASLESEKGAVLKGVCSIVS